jgi:hypothetical protein
MSDIMKFENLQDRIIEIRGKRVLLDADVAEIYGVETPITRMTLVFTAE